MSRIKDLTGARFGRLTVLSLAGKRTADGHVLWDCQCDCGTTCTINSNNLRRGPANGTQSCGCLRRSDQPAVKRKREEMTAERVRELFVYHPETGLFTRRTSTGDRWRAGMVAGTSLKNAKKGGKPGYVFINIDGHRYSAGRLAWLYMTGDWPKVEIDHWDTDPSNNRWGNLRDVTSAVNQQNKRKAPSGKKYSNLLGAHYCKKRKRWMSSIKVNGKYQYIGWFDTDVEASNAYIERKRQVHEGCTI